MMALSVITIPSTRRRVQPRTRSTAICLRRNSIEFQSTSITEIAPETRIAPPSAMNTASRLATMLKSRSTCVAGRRR